MKNYSNVLAVAAAVLLAACASADQALHEPQLTNPPRRIEWQGWDASEEDADATVAQRKYDGALRLPLSEDWEWELPDDGVWAISRLELASPAVAPSSTKASMPASRAAWTASAKRTGSTS